MKKQIHLVLPENSLWSIISYYGKNKHRSHVFTVKCRCGNESQVVASNLRTGRSLGCHACRQKMRKTKHGDSGVNRPRIYRIWANMKHRVKVAEHYEHVDLCAEWEEYKQFKDWAMQNGYNNKLEIDRIDSLGNYEPSNCRWVTHAENLCNRLSAKNSSSIYIGVTKLSNELYVAQIDGKGERLFSERFDNELDAAQARDQFIIDNSLKYYRLNF